MRFGANANGLLGGEARAAGGDGADCTQCPGGAGGAGGDAAATGGRGGNASGNDVRLGGPGGDADVTGGLGGAGASCCGPPASGGAGGAGGAAVAMAGEGGTPFGEDGENATKAGDGGDGGDGQGPGAGGAAGEGTNVPDGSPGDPGGMCVLEKCDFDLDLGQLEPGPIMAGTNSTVASEHGPVVIRYASQAEFQQNTGNTSVPSYELVGDRSGGVAIRIDPGWIEIDVSGLACLPEAHISTVNVLQAPVFSSSFEASGAALNHAPGLFSTGNGQTFTVTSGEADRIDYQVIWTPGEAVLTDQNIN
jgi:hypothetical protein